MVTVAICTWNASALLRQTLTSLTALHLPDGVDWEVLVINNACTDDTDVVVAGYSTHLPLRLVHEPEPGLARARNRALREARGSLIIWTDDDVQVDRNWLRAVVEAAARHPEAVAFGGPIAPWFPISPDPDLREAFPALAHGFCGLNLGDTEFELRPDEPIWGANMCHRRSALDGLFFNPDYGVRGASLVSGEEIDFLDRLRARGGRAWWVPEMRVRHYVKPERMTLGYLLRHAEDGGRTHVRATGIPAGRRVFGVPRWMFGRFMDHTMGYWMQRLRGRRARAFDHLRQARYVRGMIRETLDGRG